MKNALLSLLALSILILGNISTNVVKGQENIWSVHYHNLSWSPDGTKMSFLDNGYSNGHSYSKLGLANPDGSNPEIITRLGNWNFNPVWSPNSLMIAVEQKSDEVASDGYFVSIVDLEGNILYQTSHFAESLNQIIWETNGLGIIYNTENSSYLYDFLSMKTISIGADINTLSWNKIDDEIIAYNNISNYGVRNFFVSSIDGTERVLVGSINYTLISPCTLSHDFRYVACTYHSGNGDLNTITFDIENNFEEVFTITMYPWLLVNDSLTRVWTPEWSYDDHYLSVRYVHYGVDSSVYRDVNTNLIDLRNRREIPFEFSPPSDGYYHRSYSSYWQSTEDVLVVEEFTVEYGGGSKVYMVPISESGLDIFSSDITEFPTFFWEQK